MYCNYNINTIQKKLYFKHEKIKKKITQDSIKMLKMPLKLKKVT